MNFPHLTTSQFMDRLTERYGKPKNDQFSADIMRYLDRVEPNLALLYDIIIDNHEYDSFPNRAKIRAFWEKYGTSAPSSRSARIIKNINRLHETWNQFDVRKIHAMCALIAKQETTEFWEREFLHRWELVYYHWERMMDETRGERETIAYCEKVKQSVIDGEQFVEPEEPDYDDAERLRKTVKAGDVIAELFT